MTQLYSWANPESILLPAMGMTDTFLVKEVLLSVNRASSPSYDNWSCLSNHAFYAVSITFTWNELI